MAEKVIGDYSAAITIDGSTHYLLIQPGSSSTQYNKINRNVLLGVTGQPADLSTSQTFTNKTIGNSNILTLRDDRFTLQDSGDTTKQAVFELSGLTTATTRTYTLPDASTTLVGTGTTQTLTNKTLTAPVITNGSITGTTITTDAIVGQSSATSGTVYGLSISSGKVGTNGVITASITDDAVTAAKMLYGMVRNRQGGTTGDNSWPSTGTSNTDTSAKSVFMQVGAVASSDNTTTANNGWFATSMQTITFPTAFTQAPLVLVTTISQHAVATVEAAPSTTGFTWKARAVTSTAAPASIQWYAVGQ